MSTTAQKKPIEIHYVDDEAKYLNIFRDAVRRLVKSSGTELVLHTYNSGERLLQSMAGIKNAGAIIFVDINMPNKSGFEVLRDIRKLHAREDLPVVMYSTSSNKNAISISHALGANLYAVKTGNLQQLMDTISKVASIEWEEISPASGNYVIRG